MSAKEKKYDYYRVVIRKAEQILEMQTLDEFIRYAQANQIWQIIKTKDFETQADCFALASRGAIYTCTTEGYELLEDFLAAIENQFPDAATFYTAREKNCATFTEYQLVLATGITDAAVFDEMKKNGYVDGYSSFDLQRKQTTTLPQMPEITNAKELYDYAVKKQFTDYKHFRKVWEAGFTDPIEHQLAIEKGLNNAQDYETFKKGGFESLEEFKQSKPLEIKSHGEMLQYNVLNMLDYPKNSFDERLLITILTQLEQRRKTSFEKLYAHFLKTEEEYKRDNGNGELKLPKWFTKRLRKESDMKEFLVQSDEVKRFGTFDAAEDVFEAISIKRRKVVIDGSNVAYNSNLADRKAGVYNAELKNIVTLINKLKEEYGFEDIHVFADNNLIHKSKDKSVLPAIKALCKYSETPAGIPADLYLINHVKKHHCLLVTNDTFKDWKLNDRWLEDNIDFYRLKFVLNGDVVMLPYMERFGKG